MAKVTRSFMAVGKKANRTAQGVRYIAAEPNRRKFYVWISHGHMATMSTAISGAENFGGSIFRCVLHSTAKVCEEVNRKCRARITKIQLSTLIHRA